jgi:hypothetical protein
MRLFFRLIVSIAEFLTLELNAEPKTGVAIKYLLAVARGAN